MKYVKVLALALLVGLTTPAVSAEGGKLFPLQCGFQLGGAAKVEKAYSPSERYRGRGFNRTIRSIAAEKPAPASINAAKADRPGHRQMPRVFTFAKFSCSWR